MTHNNPTKKHKKEEEGYDFLIEEPDDDMLVEERKKEKNLSAPSFQNKNASCKSLEDMTDPTELLLNNMKPSVVFPGHVELSFFGAAGTVTGSKHLITNGDLNVLIDCGMFQGLKELREKNWQPISSRMAVERICDAVIITHAHLDHTGYLPRMVRLGYTGPIYMTKETRQLTEIILMDSAHLQEEDAKFLTKKKCAKHDPALPFITQDDVMQTMRQIVEVDYHTPTVIKKENSDSSLQFTYFNAGHILGSCYAFIEVRGRKILFSGDLGTMKSGRSLQVVPEMPPNSMDPDYLLIESTYGDRLLQGATTDENAVTTEEFIAPQLEEAIKYICDNNGVCLIPAFSVGRAQVLAYMLLNLMEQKKIPRCPVHLDTPMGTKAMSFYIESLEKRTDLKQEEKKRIEKLLAKVIIHESPMSSKQLKMETLHQSVKKKIIISSAGMLTGGRVIHHLKDLLPNGENIILMSGYQAAGTRGRSLLDGAKKLKMFGEWVPVGAKIVKLQGISAHADAQDLIKFLTSFEKMPKQVFVIHGEPESSRTLARTIAEELKTPALVPKRGTTFHLVHDDKQVSSTIEQIVNQAIANNQKRMEEAPKEIQAIPERKESDQRQPSTTLLTASVIVAVAALLFDIYLRL